MSEKELPPYLPIEYFTKGAKDCDVIKKFYEELKKEEPLIDMARLDRLSAWSKLSHQVVGGEYDPRFEGDLSA